ncbi:MAG: hypothetical protein P1U68_07590 [Verrucomicrobiales bacterium]|nr:hypothetical protein [Verrucomicrobiales bacterium]
MLYRFLLFLLFPVATAPLHAGKQLLSVSYPDIADTEVQAESIFGLSAQQGALPFRIKIRNNSGKDRTWTVSLREGSYGRTLATEWQGKFTVESGTEVVHDVTVPFPPKFASYSYRNLEATFNSPGLEPVKRSHSYQMNNGFPVLAMSQSLSARSLANLNNILKKKNSNIQRFAESFDPPLLPGDWKGYTGLDGLLIDLRSWKELRAAPKKAILEWLRLGGTLYVFASTKDFPDSNLNDLEIEGLKAAPDHPHAGKLSLGEIKLRRWNGIELSSGIETVFENASSPGYRLEDDFGEKWPLGERLGTKPFNAILIFGILLVFAILVAPVNLFFLAGKGKRHRLFVTTPIISVAACLIIVLMILIGDGLGGNGYRIAFVDLQSGNNERRFFVSQEQVSRTGVIVNTGFESEKDLLIEPVKLERNPFSALDHRSGQTTNFIFSGRQFMGGFFRSRAQQGYVVRNAESTRARIEQQSENKESNTPTLVSSLPSSITRFYYRDAGGNIWTSASQGETPPGGTIQLTSASEEDFDSFISQQLSLFSNTQRNQIRNLSTEDGRFFAIPSDPASYLLETHPGIRWSDDHVLLSGNIQTSAP